MKINELVPWKWGKDGELMKHDWDLSLESMQREMNQLFDSFSRSMFDRELDRPGFSSLVGAIPKMDVSETHDEIEVTAELPGMEEKDIDVSLSKEVLTIRGEKKQEKEEKKKDFYRMERMYGSFHRSIPLPAEIDTEKVEAKFKNGVLTIKLPKTPEAKKEVKKIAVKTV